jgi:hypothetical protein
MVLEKLLLTEFEQLLGWLAQGSLRDELAKLEASAGKPVECRLSNAALRAAAASASVHQLNHKTARQLRADSLPA